MIKLLFSWWFLWWRGIVPSGVSRVAFANPLYAKPGSAKDTVCAIGIYAVVRTGGIEATAGAEKGTDENLVEAYEADGQVFHG